MRPTRLQESKVIMAKLSREDFTKLQKYCELKNESVNFVIKRLILEELEDPTPHMIAGKNIFSYNKYKDNFSWRISLDQGLIAYIEEDMPAESLLQLHETIKKAIDERNTYTNKKKEESIPISSKLLRGKIGANN